MNPTLKHNVVASLVSVAVLALGMASVCPAKRAIAGAPSASTVADAMRAAALQPPDPADIGDATTPTTRQAPSRRVRQALVMPYFSFGSRG